MDGLPLEIKFMIARYIYDECIENLHALSLANKEWNRIASPLLYGHIIIYLHKGYVAHKLLWQPEGVLAHMKRLSIIVLWYPDGSPYVPDVRYYSGLRDTLTRKSGDLGDQSIPRLDCYSTNHKYSTGVIDFIHKVPQLQDIDLLTSNGGPVELHEAIRQYHPSCRVSLYLSPQVLGGKNRIPDRCYHKRNYQVLSPQLHIVYVTLFEHPVRGKFIEHPDSVLEDVIFCAPHAYRLALQILAGGEASSKEKFNETVVIERKSEIEPLRAKLKQLAWPLNTTMPAAQFLKWDQLVDYSYLKSWTVGCIEDTQLPCAIANIRPFQQLNRLTLALFPPKDDELSFYTATEAMFDSLPPLTYLCLLGSYRPTLLTATLRKHGPTLLELKLNVGPQDWNPQVFRRLLDKGQRVTGPLCSVEEVHSLAAHCPSLQTLCMTVQRNCGLETPVYTALALLPALTTLELYLNCLPHVDPNESEPISPVPPRDLTDFERAQPPPFINLDMPTGYIRDTMINSAIDEDLARNIFTHIRALQVGNRRLAKLKIRPLYAGPEAAASIMSPWFHSNFFKALDLSWTVQTDPDSLSGLKAVIDVQKIKGLRRPLRSQNDLQFEIIFNSVWPPVEGEAVEREEEEHFEGEEGEAEEWDEEEGENNDNWLQRWHSWPLQ